MELTDKQEAELLAIRNLPDDQIDTSDSPEILDWWNAVRVAVYQPVKRDVTVKLDEYVIDWSKDNAEDWQEAISQVLLEHIRQQRLPSRKAVKKAGS